MEQENNKIEQIDLMLLIEDFLREGRRIWALAVVLVVVCCASLGGYRYLNYTPHYQATECNRINFVTNVMMNVPEQTYTILTISLNPL